MAIRVIVYAPSAVSIGSFAGVHFVLDGDRLRIGRARDCDVRLPDLSVSHHHASVERDGRGYALVDEGSNHGTRLGALDSAESIRLAAGHRHPISGPALARIGPFLLAFCPEPDGQVDPPYELETATVRLAVLSGTRWGASVLVRRGPQQGERFHLQDHLAFGRSYDRAHVFGRDPRSDAQLHGQRTSRHHFEVKRGDNVLWVKDLGSTNGTWLDGRRLRPNASVRWRRGALLYAGDHAFERDDPGNDALEELDRKEGDAFTGAPPPPASALEEEKVRRCAAEAFARAAECRSPVGEAPRGEEETDELAPSTVRARAPVA
jgi:pSer/pThr/pTyr-binding forkhead associated (FHA) protein